MSEDGPTGATGSIDTTGLTGLTGPTGPVPVIITIQDILSATELLQQKEAADRVLLEGIGNVTFESLKSKLLVWATSGFPNAYSLMDVPIQPPALCSDGQARTLSDYIIFCSGKTIQDHVAVLQAKLPDISVSFANMGTSIAVVVSRS